MRHKAIIVRTHDDRTGMGILPCYWDQEHDISACPGKLELRNSL